MRFKIRQEMIIDYLQTEKLVQQAFNEVEMSDQSEHILVAALRKGAAFVPELSLLAEVDGELAGHLLLTRQVIRGAEGEEVETLALAPISVVPTAQGLGIGSRLIEAGLAQARRLGFQSVFVLGHPDYYSRFGFKPASIWGIQAEFDVPDEAFMGLELVEGSLEEAKGILVYSAEFHG